MTATPPKPSQWIAVEERLPPDQLEKGWNDRGEKYHCSDTVLTWNGSQTTAEMLTNPKGESVWVCGDETVKAVTHWMPLPDPPAGLADETALKEK